MTNGIQPLKGSISNLNWFDSQRKHYETPDQIARRFHLRDDAGMRSFCKQAVQLNRERELLVRRAVACDKQTAWNWITTPTNLKSGLSSECSELSLNQTLEFEHDPFWNGEVTELEDGSHIKVERATGGYWMLKVIDLDPTSVLGRDLPDSLEDICELQVLDQLGDSTEVDSALINSDIHEEHFVQPGGPGTHWVGLCVDWHYQASLIQEGLFSDVGENWPIENAVNLDREPLIQCYAKLLGAYHSA